MKTKCFISLSFACLASGMAGCSQPPTRTVSENDSAAAASAARVAVREVSIAEAKTLISSAAPLTVLDVRTPGEFAEGHIEGAVNLDFTSPDFVDQLARLDRDGAYLLHCKSGARSAKALATMKEAGFGEVAHMSKGFDAWKASGLPVAQ